MSLEAGDEIHYVAVLDRELRMLQVVAMERPLVIPIDEAVESVSCDVRLSVTMKTVARS